MGITGLIVAAVILLAMLTTVYGVYNKRRSWAAAVAAVLVAGGAGVFAYAAFVEPRESKVVGMIFFLVACSSMGVVVRQFTGDRVKKD